MNALRSRFKRILKKVLEYFTSKGTSVVAFLFPWGSIIEDCWGESSNLRKAFTIWIMT